MGLSCRICKKVFSVPLTSEEEPSEDFNIKAIKCGHLFHQKCLEASLTHQKLSHAMHGTGPFRKLCPAFQCGTLITLDNDIIKLSVAPEELYLDAEVNDDTQSSDIRLTKQVQRLALERDQWKTKADSLWGENEIFKDAMDQIKYECEELRSFLNEEESIQKGDRIFWVNADGSFSPAKIIEIRQKSTQSMPFVVIKLERKKKTVGSGFQGERETFIVAANEILTFKSFFKEYFEEFSYKLRNIMSEMVTPQSDFVSGTSIRKLSKKRSSAGDIMRSTSCGSLTTPSVFAISVEAIDKLNFGPSFSSSSSAVTAAVPQAKVQNQQRTNGIYRRKTIHSGSVPGKTSCSARAYARNRSVSHSYPQSLSWSENKSQSFDTASLGGSVFNSPIGDKNSDYPEHDIIYEPGERVIRHCKSYCDHAQVGNVVATFQYTKCAIVKFDKVPHGPPEMEYRTVPTHELFPYDLASMEEKYDIAVIYGQSLEYQGYDIMEEVEEYPMNINKDDSQQELYQKDYNANRSDRVSQYDVIPSTIRPPSFSSETSEESTEETKTAYDVVTALLFSMFYSTHIFERTLLSSDSSDNEKQISIKKLLDSDVTGTAKSTGNLPEEFVQELVTILELGMDDYIQPADFLTALFRDTMQCKPFINLTTENENQFVLNLAIPEYFGENDLVASVSLQDLLEKTLHSSDKKFSSMPSPALILSVNRPHYSRGSYIIPPVKLNLAQAVAVNNDEDLCSCNKVATWKCGTCVEVMEIAPGYCDDCRHSTADFHKELDHFPILSYSKDGSNKKLRLIAVVCKSKNHFYSSFIKCGMVHSDSWVLCQPTYSSGEKKSDVTPVGSVQSWLDNLDGEGFTEKLSISQKIPHHVKKLLVQGCLFIYSPMN